MRQKYPLRAGRANIARGDGDTEREGRAVSSVVQWIVRRVWPHLPALPIAAFAALTLYIGFCNAHLPCAPIRLDLGLPSEDEIPADTYAADAPPGTIRW